MRREQTFKVPGLVSLGICLVTFTSAAMAQIGKDGNGKDVRSADDKALEEAFKGEKTRALPLGETEIRELIKDALRVNRAEAPLPAKARRIVMDISLDPAAPPPEVKVMLHRLTTLSFVDITGEPWPLKDRWASDGFAFPEKSTVGHVLRVETTGEINRGDLSVTLDGLPTDLTFTLAADGDDKKEQEFYQHVTVRILKVGPNGKPPLVDIPVAFHASDDAMMAFVTGVPPEQACPLTADNKSVQAWKYQGAIYLRTSLALLFPGALQQSGVEGYRVYQIPAGSPELRLADEGQEITVHLADVIGPADQLKVTCGNASRGLR